MNWMVLPLRRYFEFTGRSRRREYWLFFLFTILLSIAAAIVDLTLGFGSAGRLAGRGVVGLGIRSNGPVAILVSLALFIPSLSVAVRRLHDTDRSGWWLLLVFLPFIGWLVLVIFYCLDGTRGGNRFGADPKSEHLGDVFA